MTMLESVNFYSEGKREEEYFVGKVFVNRVYDAEITKDLKVYFVTFYGSAKTRLHIHDSDQVLIASEGQGEVGIINRIKDGGIERSDDMMQVESKECVKLPAGQSVVIPAGKLHWHGADGTTEKFSHISILRSGKSEWF